MEEAPNQPAESSTVKPKPPAPKDKVCQFCHQAFTSSSLGRHYDTYVISKDNTKPKSPDEDHNEEAIEEMRKLRMHITRRNPKGSVSRRGTSASVGTPVDISKKASPSTCNAESPSVFQSPVSVKGSGDRPSTWSGREFPSSTPWQVTGVMNDKDARHGPKNRRPGLPSDWTTENRQPDVDSKDKDQKIQDAEDRARAAELALRELIGSFRAAKQHIDMDSTPFDFDPLELDFPALVLQCLAAPAALLASMPTPTPTSWSLDPPGPKELEALKGYFQQEFRKWKISCAAATTAIAEDLTYPPPETLPQTDPQESIRKAEEKAEEQEKRVTLHIMSTYNGWSNIPEAQREFYWKLELARSVQKKQKQVDKLKQVGHTLRQENEDLKGNMLHLNRLQQPREYKIVPPTTIPFDPKLVSYLAEESVVHNKRGVGLNLGDRHSDLNTIVSSSIDRWKSVIISTRPTNTASRNRQPLYRADTGEPEPGANVNTANVSKPQGQAQVEGQVQDRGQTKPSQPQQQQVQQQAQQPQQHAQQLQPQPQPHPQYQQVQQQTQHPLPHGLPQQSQLAFQGYAQANTSSEGAQASAINSATVSPADPDANEDDDEDDEDESSDGDADKDGDADEDVDGDSDADADGDAEMEDGSAYNTMASPLPGIPQQQQQHALLAQQQHQRGNQIGAIRTRPTGAQGRFNPLQANNSTGRSVTGGSAIHPARGNNNNMHLMNRSVCGNNSMAALGGVHPQYPNGHMAGIDPSQGGLRVGHSLGNMEEDSQRMSAVPPQGGVREDMYIN